MNPLVIATLLSALAAAGTTWRIMEWRYEAREAELLTEQAKAKSEAQEHADRVAGGYALVVKYLEEQKRGRTIEVVKEIEKPIYRDVACALPESGRMLINDAVRKANAAAVSGTVLPKDSGVAGK